MVSKKTQSKRGTARQRYKIQKKVRDHQRKVKKDMKKHPEKYRNKSRKDPGIPKMWPFRDQVLKQIEETKANMENEKEQLRLRRVQQLGTDKAQKRELVDLKREAEKRNRAFDKEAEENLNKEDSEASFSDSSKRAYYREFRKVLEEADVLLEVLDARDPAGCRSPDIEQMILASGTNKKVILVLNKVDLVPRIVAEKWLKHFRHEFPTVLFKASTQEQRQKLKSSTMTTSAASSKTNSGVTSECLGADALMQLLKNYCRSLNRKTAITVGVIGYPNVGKSSLINSLKRSRACVVGAMPGVTKSMQEIHLDRDIRLLDCPGIIFRQNGPSQGDLLLRNCLKIDQLEDPLSAVEAVLSRCRREDLMLQYAIPAFNTSTEFLLLLAKLKGKLKKGGAPDLNATAKMLLQDWNNGKISFYTLPPDSRDAMEGHTSTIVSQWSPEFDLSQIASTEEKLLASLPENSTASSGVLMSSSEPLKLDENMLLSMDEEEENDDDEDDEDEDLDEFEESDEDAMEDEQQESNAVSSKASSLVLTQPKIKAGLVSSKKKDGHHLGMTAEEEALNPRLNQTRKKAVKAMMKKEKKKEKKTKFSIGVPMKLDDREDAFDFADDFVPAAEYDENDEVDMKESAVDIDEEW